MNTINVSKIYLLRVYWKISGPRLYVLLLRIENFRLMLIIQPYEEAKIIDID